MTTGTKSALAGALAAAAGLAIYALTLPGGREAGPPLGGGADPFRAERVESRRPEAAAKEGAGRPDEHGGEEPAAPAPVPRPDPGPDAGGRDRIQAGLKAEPGSPQHEGALRELSDLLCSAAERDDLAAVAWAGDRFDREARAGRVTPAEAETLDSRFRGLAPGSAARPGLAAGIAGGWATDERLGAFLGNLGARTEADVHHRLLRILDHHPSSAFGDYAARMLRETDDDGVLRAVLDEDRIEAACESGRGGIYGEALQDRLRAGPAPGQKKALLVGLARLALRDPDDALPRLRQAAAAEPDAGTAAKLAEAVRRIEKGEASGRDLARLLD